MLRSYSTGTVENVNNVCDMTPESRNSPLLDNGSLGTFPQQRINTWKPDRCYEINTRSHVNGHVTNDLHGYRSGHAEFVIRKSVQ
jgi:hypothetical protein